MNAGQDPLLCDGEVGGAVTIYDTLDHQIGGFSQQQSSDGTMTCSSQYGTVSLGSLPVVSINGQPPVQMPAPAPWSNQGYASGNTGSALAYSAASGPPADVLATVQKLAELHSASVLTAVEFSAKKADLLSRL